MANTTPTWYGGISKLFNATDIAHMAQLDVDLSSYTYVSEHAPMIYQQVSSGNMPPGNPWPSSQVTMFLDWMNAGCPKGTPTTDTMAKTANFTAQTATRIRKDITQLSSDEITTLKKAFNGIMALSTTDLNSYFVQAGYHWLPAGNTYCMHHAPAFLSWHRAYMLSFENALRSIEGCEDVTVPYWDITGPYPSILNEAPFDSYTFPVAVGDGYNAGDKTQRYTQDKIEANLAQFTVTDKVNKAMSQTDWEDFNGYFAGAANNTLISAHDNGHNSIGQTMANQDVAAFDPIFWFFHCNWDRLMWVWQKQMSATDVNGLLNTINKETDLTSYQTYTIESVGVLPPFTTSDFNVNAIDTVDSAATLDVDYADPAQAAEVNMVTKTTLNSTVGDKFQVNRKMANVRVSGVNRLKIPGAFNVHLMQDDDVIASTGMFQPSEAEKCSNCVQNAIVHFDFELPIKQIAKGKLGVWVEPHNKDFVGDRFPAKLMGNPKIEVSLIMQHD